MAFTDQNSRRREESVSEHRPTVGIVPRQKSSIYVPITFGIPFLSAMIFSLITNHAWEDWYITYRSSVNLATGYGLVYDPAQKVHSFTSPIGTLLPAAIKFFVSASDDGVLWWFRITQSCILGFSGLLLLGMGRELRLSNWTYALLFGLFSVDAKILDFSTNGMAGFLVFFIALTAYGLMMPFRRPGLVLGAAWAGLMWTRPDGFIYIVALSLGFLVFPRAAMFGSSRWTIIKTFFLASVLTAFLHLPWLIWALVYYGSFVPYSLTAKGVGFDLIKVVKAILSFPITGLIRTSALDDIFTPAYAANFGGWPRILADVSRIISWLCSFAWVLPVLRPVTRAMSLATLVAELYLSCVIPYAFPWYIPGTTVLVIVVLSLLFEEMIIRGIPYQPKRTASLVPILAIVPIFTTLVLTICVAYQARVQQHVIEDKNRKQIGLWLHDHASSSQDRVFLEPLGYVGFYSNLRMYGFPGQSSPELVAARRALSCTGEVECFAVLISFLNPEWLVLRPYEADRVRKDDSTLLTKVYTLVKTFDVSSELASYTFLPGRQWLQFDQTFLVYM